MADELQGKKIAILAADGVEQVELEQPRDAVTQAGAEVELISLQTGEIQAMNHDIDPGDTFAVDKAVADASPDDYDGLLLPGGTVNPDKLRIDEGAVAFVRAFFDSGKPIGAICHGPWTLVEADVVRGRTLASWPSLRGPGDQPQPGRPPGVLRQGPRGVRRGAPPGPDCGCRLIRRDADITAQERAGDSTTARRSTRR
jgi:protease I